MYLVHLKHIKITFLLNYKKFSCPELTKLNYIFHMWRGVDLNVANDISSETDFYMNKQVVVTNVATGRIRLDTSVVVNKITLKAAYCNLWFKISTTCFSFFIY